MNDHELAKLCVLSYTDSTFQSGDVEVLLKCYEDVNVIAIRGTEASEFFSGRGWLDVIRDLRVWPKDIGNTAGHAGFVSGYKQIFEYVDSILLTSKSPVILTGHSMGGAIALITGYMMEIDIPNRLHSVVTFGAPRCIVKSDMKLNVIESLTAKTKQYQHVQDKVPGFMAYTYYEHIDNTFLPHRFANGERAGYFQRGYKYHGMNVYRDLVGQLNGLA